MTPAPEGIPRASFAWLCRTSFIVQSRTLPRRRNREESGEERPSLYRLSYIVQPKLLSGGLCYGLFSGESGHLRPEQPSRQQSRLHAGQSPGSPAGPCAEAMQTAECRQQNAEWRTGTRQWRSRIDQNPERRNWNPDRRIAGPASIHRCHNIWYEVESRPQFCRGVDGPQAAWGAASAYAARHATGHATSRASTRESTDGTQRGTAGATIGATSHAAHGATQQATSDAARDAAHDAAIDELTDAV